MLENRSMLSLLGPKKSFLAGMVVTFFGLTTIGFFIMLALVLDLDGSSAEASGSAKATNTNNAAAAPTAPTPTANGNITVQPVSDSDWVRGDRDASVTIVEFSDTECPYCKRFHETMLQVMEEYDGQVNWVYRHFPLASLHSKAPKEAEATECAGELGGNDGFWAFLDELFDTTPSNNGLSADQLPEIAAAVGLDKTAFESCLNSGKYSNKVDEQLGQATAAGGTGTPYSILLAGSETIPVSGALPYAQIKQMIDSVL